MKTKKVRAIVYTALTAAILCVVAPISVPIPFTQVPVSLTILILCLMCYLAGWKCTFIAYCIYFVLGAVGLPVFSNFMGGLSKIAGPTGGYIIGFFLMIPIAGICIEKAKGKYARIFLPIAGMAIGIAVSHLFGMIWFAIIQKTTIAAAFTMCSLPFIPFELIKIGICVAIGTPLRRRLDNLQIQ